MAVALSCLRRFKERVPLSGIHAFLEAAKKSAGYGSWDIGCRVTSDLAIRRLNKKYRGVDAATDILSFAFHELQKPEEWPADLSEEDKNLGDMVISADYVTSWCATNGVSEHRRYETLLTHGLVHLLGYDHETDEQFRAMHGRENAILEATLSILRPWEESQDAALRGRQAQQTGSRPAPPLR
jgi:probable rRNA maturation factor